jgi:ankyrin repeat protein
VAAFDMYGNNAIHQAAAAGQIEVLKCFLQKGVDVDVRNARLHTPMELATNPETKKLLSKAVKTKNCQACKSRFDFKNLRYLCTKSDKFYCKNCCVVSYEYE